MRILRDEPALQRKMHWVRGASSETQPELAALHVLRSTSKTSKCPPCQVRPSKGCEDWSRAPVIVGSNPTAPPRILTHVGLQPWPTRAWKVAVAESFQIASRSEFLVRELEPAS